MTFKVHSRSQNSGRDKTDITDRQVDVQTELSCKSHEWMQRVIWHPAVNACIVIVSIRTLWQPFRVWIVTAVSCCILHEPCILTASDNDWLHSRLQLPAPSLRTFTVVSRDIYADSVARSHFISCLNNVKSTAHSHTKHTRWTSSDCFVFSLLTRAAASFKRPLLSIDTSVRLSVSLYRQVWC